MTAQTGSFTVSFDATPSNSTVDAVIGLSKGSGSGFSKYATAVRFSVKGTIDARSGNQYTAASTIGYTGGKTYRVRMAVNVPARTYSVYVTAPGGTEQVVGENYLFRNDQVSLTSLDYWGAYAGFGTVSVCNFIEGDTPPVNGSCETASKVWQAHAIGPFSGAFTAEFEATPKAAGIDGLIGISNGAGATFTDFATLVRFSTNNRIDVRNGNTFAAQSVVGYTANTKYRFRIVANVATRKYDVYVQPTGGQETQLASGYSFRTEQMGVTSLNNWGAYADFGAMDVCNFKAAAQTTNQLPTAKATATPTTGTAPLAVQFDGSGSTDPDGTIASYSWAFGDGQTATGAKVSHTYATAGTYKAVLTVTDDKAAKSTASVTITASGSTNQLPKAVAVADTTSGPAPLTVNLDASGSSDPDGSIVSYAWAFGDATTGTGAKVAHSYGKVGTYTAKVTVTDDKGATASATVTITVSEQTACESGSTTWQSLPMGTFDDLMTAEFDVTPQTAGVDGIVGLSSDAASWYTQLAAMVRFSVANTIDARNGDVYGAANTVAYTAGTTYRVRMVVDVPARTYDAFVTPAGGQEKQIAAGYKFRTEQASATALSSWTPITSFGTMDVCNFAAKPKTRNKAPVASGTVTPTTGEAPLAIQCNASGCTDADGTIVGHEWDFGDGTKATTVQASHTYTKAGQYKVVLTATDNGGATGTKEFAVSATAPPGACVTSSASWQNTPMTAQNGAFTVEFDATPNAAYMDGGVVLSAAAVADYPDSVLAVRFNSAGLIDARNGGGYSSDATMAYTAGKTYHFRLTVSIPSHSYSVYVTPTGGAEQLLAQNYAFRTEQMNATSIANWATWAGSATQTHDVCNFTIGTPPPAALAVSTKTLDFGLNTTNLPIEVWNSGGSALNYSIADNVDWLTISPTSGSSAGERDTITATVNRSGLAAGTYQGTITVTPSTGAAITIAVAMQYGTVPQVKLKPIARWDTIAYQRINAGSTLNAGVVAFSKYGIARVRFTISGQGYTGVSPIDVTDMTLNPQTGVYEYWTPISASKFTTDGVITVDATVYGNDGGVRDKTSDGGGVGLDTLRLVVNATGRLTQAEAWVSTSGNDSTAVVNDSAKPFRTIGQAISKIRAYRNSVGAGYNADGGIVRLVPGTHYCSDGGAAGPIACDNEWVTITTAAGGTRSNTVLMPGGIPATRKIALRGITLKNSGVIGMGYSDRTQAHVWADDCTIIGDGRGITTAHPLSSEYGYLYYTGCSITEVHQATSGSKLCRGLTITRISDDAFQNVPAIYNCTVDDVDPLSTGAHADAWQHAMGNPWNKTDDNVIVYNLRATNLKYQSVFIRPDIYSSPSYAQGMAFVNVYMQMRSDSNGWGGWYRWVDHLLWWNCSYTVKGIGIMPDTYNGTKMDCSIKNMSVKGCDFSFLGIGGSDGGVDYSDWKFNHFGDPSTTRGTNFTTGADYLDSYGVPLSNSPLLDKFSPVVPVDARNKVRSGNSDVGAYER